MHRSSLFLIFTASLAFTACSTLHVQVEKSHDATKASPKVPCPEDSPKVLRAISVSKILTGVARNDTSAIHTYNDAVASAVILARANNFKDSPALHIDRSGAGLLDPADFDSVLMASEIRVTGLATHSSSPGAGIPVALWANQQAKVLEGQPGIPKVGMTLPATAILTEGAGVVSLQFHNTLESDHARLDGHRVLLATDFSAPLAYGISKGVNSSLDIKALFQIQKNLINAQLYQLEPYDPNKIPLVFVHGLLCRPEAWAQASNQLLADPKIRKHYQFWYFRYPTGLPIWASAALLRSELDRFQKQLDPEHRNPNMNRKILVGHSMGGLICDLMVRKGGSGLWSQFSDQPLDQLAVRPTLKKRMERLLNFEPRKDVVRVIFVATPHRGSPLALRQLAGFLASFIKLPYLPLNSDKTVIHNALHSNMRRLFSAPANGISCLRSQSPILLSILKLQRKDVPYHSIIGDQGKNNSPHSSDGIVPYWSSHMDGAASERIVPSGHGANENSEGIAEINRILVSAAKE
jgi:pimeloyl-ACP methyl ester carboxylesterase